jgi:hypothetical protein
MISLALLVCRADAPMPTIIASVIAAVALLHVEWCRRLPLPVRLRTRTAAARFYFAPKHAADDYGRATRLLISPSPLPPAISILRSQRRLLFYFAHRPHLPLPTPRVPDDDLIDGLISPMISLRRSARAPASFAEADAVTLAAIRRFEERPGWVAADDVV